MDPSRAIVEVENYLYATSQLAQTTLRSVLGQAELDELLSEREKINASLQEILDRTPSRGAIKVTKVEVKNVDLPQEMQRAIAKQAEAERERRAKIINAEGEFQAAAAAGRGGERDRRTSPTALQLRYLQTLAEIATENNSTTIFPVPIDLFTPFMEVAKAMKKAPSRRPATFPRRGERKTDVDGEEPPFIGERDRRRAPSRFHLRCLPVRRVRRRAAAGGPASRRPAGRADSADSTPRLPPTAVPLRRFHGRRRRSRTFTRSPLPYAPCAFFWEGRKGSFRSRGNRSGPGASPEPLWPRETGR